MSSRLRAPAELLLLCIDLLVEGARTTRSNVVPEPADLNHS